MEQNGSFLETGSYNGHYYGTPKPLLSDLIMKDDTTKISTENLELETRTAKDTESNEQVTVHHESENLNVKGLENDSANDRLKKDESLQNQPISV